MWRQSSMDHGHVADITDVCLQRARSALSKGPLSVAQSAQYGFVSSSWLGWPIGTAPVWWSMTLERRRATSSWWVRHGSCSRCHYRHPSYLVYMLYRHNHVLVEMVVADEYPAAIYCIIWSILPWVMFGINGKVRDVCVLIKFSIPWLTISSVESL